MKDLNEKKLSVEIAVVGSRYGELAHVFKPIFDKQENVGLQDIRRAMNDDELVLMPIENNPYDRYAVAVMTLNRQRLGYVWMYQAPAIVRNLKHHRRKYMKVHLSRVCVSAGVIMVSPDDPMELSDIERFDKPLDMSWAEDLPQERNSLTEYTLCAGMELLYEELSKKPSWTPRLQQLIDEQLRMLPLDLSAHHYKEAFDVYNLMVQSDDETLQQMGEIMLSTFVHRGSEQQMEWWAENWLSSYFREVEDSSLLHIFEEDGYTLQRVEQLLEQAPCHLFTMYKTGRQQFAKSLYYAALPLKLYNRLLTLLAVWELMRNRDVKRQQLPAGKLSTPAAKAYWARLQDGGYVDDDCQLTSGTTRKQAMYIAELFSEKLKMKTKWKPFEQLWHLSNLAQEKYDMQQTGVMPIRYEDIDRIFEE